LSAAHSTRSTSWQRTAASRRSLTTARSGVGAVFNLGKTNKVGATSTLTGSTGHQMLSVTNSGAGPALSLQVAKGRARDAACDFDASDSTSVTRP
jgi:hypothetical protein